MKKRNYVNIAGITVILLALMISMLDSNYTLYCNIAALAAFGGVCLYQIYGIYQAQGEWKKYLLIMLLMIAGLGIILFL